jgi:hypothetical protein
LIPGITEILRFLFSGAFPIPVEWRRERDVYANASKDPHMTRLLE